MAQKFYYDSVDILNATLNDGTVAFSGTESFADGTTLTNEERAVDQSISTVIADWAENDALQFDLGSAKAVDFMAIYFNAAESDDIRLGYDDAATGNVAADIEAFTSCVVGWNVVEFSEQSYRYWVVSAKDAGGLAGITEIILGSKLEFESHPDIVITEVDSFGTTINKSMGGQEYGVKIHEPITEFTLKFANMSATHKASLISMQDDIQNFKKFIWYDETTYHWVKLVNPIQFTEVAFERYSASIKLRQQLV